MFATLKRIGLRGVVYKVFGRLFPNDDIVLSACARIGAYRYLKKYQNCVKPIDNPDPVACDETPKNQKIWICWLQGFENAPLLVQKCRDSVLKYSSNCEVVLLDDSNINKYVSIPDYIVEKHKKGIIPHAHYSDYARTAILAKHGGIWIDSTVLLTDNLPDYILKADLFCYKVQPLGKVVASNWFIAAKPKNPIVLNVLQLLGEYWKHENKLISYSIFHLFWTMTVTANEVNRKLWDAVPYMDDVNCKLLQMELFSPYSELRFKQISNVSSVHKLTYKFDEKETLKENTFYGFITKH